METEKTSEQPKQPSSSTRPSAKRAESAPAENFAELLKLDPKQVASVKVLPPAQPENLRREKEMKRTSSGGPTPTPDRPYQKLSPEGKQRVLDSLKLMLQGQPKKPQQGLSPTSQPVEEQGPPPPEEILSMPPRLLIPPSFTDPGIIERVRAVPGKSGREAWDPVSKAWVPSGERTDALLHSRALSPAELAAAGIPAA
jgi:hypothetical protein